MLTFSSLMLFAWLFFVLRAWFDTGDEIRQHDAEMARVKRRTAAANAAFLAWEQAHGYAPTTDGAECARRIIERGRESQGLPPLASY